MKRALLFLPPLLLAACSQDNAPAEKVEQAAEDIVEVAQGTPVAAEEPEGAYAPRDECGSLEGAAEFRQKLAQAIERRDTGALVALAAQDIKLDFGGGAGAVELGRRLDAEGSTLWQDLSELMTLGCAANDQGGMTIPWHFDQQYQDDPYQSLIVSGEDIPLLSPRDGKPLARLSWEAVKLVSSLQPDAPFQKVSYGEIPEAYVATPVLRSPIDYRLTASSRNGAWSITSFVAGD